MANRQISPEGNEAIAQVETMLFERALRKADETNVADCAIARCEALLEQRRSRGNDVREYPRRPVCTCCGDLLFEGTCEYCADDRCSCQIEFMNEDREDR